MGRSLSIEDNIASSGFLKKLRTGFAFCSGGSFMVSKSEVKERVESFGVFR